MNALSGSIFGALLVAIAAVVAWLKGRGAAQAAARVDEARKAEQVADVAAEATHAVDVAAATQRREAAEAEAERVRAAAAEERPVDLFNEIAEKRGTP
jgi:phosphoribosylformimino-5-aminoimidazole carboxamide ribonucleotide (ProFAR) isomerase